MWVFTIIGKNYLNKVRMDVLNRDIIQINKMIVLNHKKDIIESEI